MTAEVCVLNKLAVALAADSAVSLGFQANKVYGSAEKIFQLAANAPVGVMIYGGTEFLGVPWETIVKEFRNGPGKKPYEKLEEYGDAVLEFLVNRKMFHEDEQDAYVLNLIHLFFEHIRTEIASRLDSVASKQDGLTTEDHPPLIESVLESIETEVMSAEWIEGFDQSTVTVIRKQYGQKISGLRKKVFQDLPMNPKSLRKVGRIATELLSRQLFGPMETGIVVAGFGKSEYMPRLCDFQVEIAAVGKLRFIRGQTIEINNNNNASIVPFAQQEMVHTFMRGIDPEYFQFIQEMTDNAVNGILEEIGEVIDPDESGQGDKIRSIISKAGERMLENLFKAWGEQQEKYWLPVIQIVNALPKDELASMAEALVNLTKFRRRVTTDRETVGGPVDVAVITRGDGFVWVNRKHYFQPGLNPRSMARYQQEGKS